MQFCDGACRENAAPGSAQAHGVLGLDCGNRTRAARVLGVSVRTLRNKIRQYSADGIDVPVHSE